MPEVKLIKEDVLFQDCINFIKNNNNKNINILLCDFFNEQANINGLNLSPVKSYTFNQNVFKYFCKYNLYIGSISIDSILLNFTPIDYFGYNFNYIFFANYSDITYFKLLLPSSNNYIM